MLIKVDSDASLIGNNDAELKNGLYRNKKRNEWIWKTTKRKRV